MTLNSLVGVRCGSFCFIAHLVTPVPRNQITSIFYKTSQVVECGRRLLLTSALVMIEPGTTTQCALACVFAFLSLVGFELIMPYTSKDDAWLYRMVGTVISGGCHGLAYCIAPSCVSTMVLARAAAHSS